jgi:hypothetical protein
MNDEAVDQADEEGSLLSYEVSDEALEAAAGNEALPTATFICSGFCCQSWATDRLALTIRFYFWLPRGSALPPFTANFAKLPELLAR